MLFPGDQASGSLDHSRVPEASLGNGAAGKLKHLSIYTWVGGPEGNGQTLRVLNCEPGHLSYQTPELLADCFQLSSFMVDFLILLKSCL